MSCLESKGNTRKRLCVTETISSSKLLCQLSVLRLRLFHIQGNQEKYTELHPICDIMTTVLKVLAYLDM